MPLASFQNMLREGSQMRRKAMLELMDAFSSGTAAARNLETLRALEYELEDDSAFLVCLADISVAGSFGHMEDDDASDDILRYYRTHCTRALESNLTRPDVTAAGIAMLGRIAEAQRDFASAQIDRLGVIAKKTTHTSIRVQTIVTISDLLPCFDSPSPEHDALANIARAMITQNDDAEVLSTAVVHLLPTVSLEIGESESSNDPSLQKMLRTSLNALTKMPDATRAPCLALAKEKWDACCIIDDIARNITEQKCDFIEPEYMEVISAAMSHSNDFDTNSKRWESVLAGSGLLDYVFVAMCDPDCSEHATRALHSLVVGSEALRKLVLGSEGLVGALRLLFAVDAEGDPYAQKTAVIFFKACIGLGGAVASATRSLLLTARPGLKITKDLGDLYHAIEGSAK